MSQKTLREGSKGALPTPEIPLRRSDFRPKGAEDHPRSKWAVGLSREGTNLSTQPKKSTASEAPRTVLPVPDITKPGLTTFDAKDPDTSFPPIEPTRPPEGAPNVLVVLLDDVGFGASTAFGGPVNTPVADRLAKRGLSYNRFHTTALCAPTRAALLHGRNHHSVGFGNITEMATSAP